MGPFTATFRISNGKATDVTTRLPLIATTIQGAIDKAMTNMPIGLHAGSLDIFVGDEKVETVGIGLDPSRT